MRVRDAALVGLLGVLAGCAGSSAPRDWLPRAVDATAQAHGGWIVLRLDDDSRHQGELIAVGPDSLFVLEPGGCSAYGHARVRNALLTGYDSEADRLQAWTIVGSISTLSHGYGLAVSLPAWLLVGSLATASQAHAGRVAVTPTTWEKARIYARFPQGLPEGIDRAALRPREPPPRTVTEPHRR